MLVDWTPARTSLAAGIIIKNTLLDRNRYRPPQVNTSSSLANIGSGSTNIPYVVEDLTITGSISVGNIEGGNGGSMPNLFGQTQSFDRFVNITQSWTGTTPSLSGSIPFTESYQYEFYNGELSGSNLVVTNGDLSDCDVILQQIFSTSSITLNGQLLLSLLAETLVDTISNLTVLQVNTDGITVKLKKSDEALYYQLCKDWEVKTKLNLEYVNYSKMIIADVNNYIAVSTKGKIKNKGRFEVDKVVGSEPAYHKDNSFRIIPLALQEYFVNNTPVETTILNHTNIYDFCGRQKFREGDHSEIHYLNGEQIIREKQQKNVRYYISNKGAVFIKHYKKGTTELINKGYTVTIFNTYVAKPIAQYNIDYNFYVTECYKEINLIIDKQLTLFDYEQF